MYRLLTAILLVAASCGEPAFAQRGDRAAAVFVETLEEQTFANRIEAIGTLEPREMVNLTLNAADRVTAIYFEDGERVPEGKTLVVLTQNEQRALVEAAEANREEASNQLERVKRLVDIKAVSRSELDEAQRSYDNATAQLRAVQSRQRDRVLVAPFSGVLGFRQISVGSYVSPGTVVATLIDDSQMRLEFSVPSIFLRSLETGTEISATTADLPGQSFSGALTSIDNAIDPVSRSIRVRATLPNEDLLLKAGMFMNVTLQASPRTALAVPEEAIEALGPRFFVYKVVTHDGQPYAERTEIEVGLRQGDVVEVINGLVPGDRLVTEGIIKVRDGGALSIKDKAILDPASRSGSRAGAVGASSASSPG